MTPEQQTIEALKLALETQRELIKYLNAEIERLKLNIFYPPSNPSTPITPSPQPTWPMQPFLPPINPIYQPNYTITCDTGNNPIYQNITLTAQNDASLG